MFSAAKRNPIVPTTAPRVPTSRLEKRIQESKLQAQVDESQPSIFNSEYRQNGWLTQPRKQWDSCYALSQPSILGY